MRTINEPLLKPLKRLRKPFDTAFSVITDCIQVSVAGMCVCGIATGDGKVFQQFQTVDARVCSPILPLSRDH